MRIVQNFTSIQLDFLANDNRLPLKYEQLENKKIEALYMLGSNRDIPIISPYSAKTLNQIYYTNISLFYLNFIDIKDRVILKNLSMNLGGFSYNQVEKNFIHYDIDRIIDINKSFIQSIGEPVNLTYLLNAFYQTENYLPFSEEVDGSLTITITPTANNQDILLKDIVENKLRDKKVKKIIASCEEMPLLSYLDLYTYSGKRIENIPTSLLSIAGQNEFYFDYLDIDFTKSYFRQRGMISFEGSKTIVKLTFIY